MASHNVLVTGTPGVGKTTFCAELASKTGMEHVEVAKLIKDNKLFSDWDDDLNCSIFDEDMVHAALEDIVSEGNKIIDFHSCDFMDDNWFKIVFVLRASNTVLFDRLEKRGYSQKKIQENVECEIFRVPLDEAFETFGEDMVLEMENNTVEEMEKNLDSAVVSIRQVSDLE